MHCAIQWDFHDCNLKYFMLWSSLITVTLNFSWRCQLSYEVLFVELGWKLKHPETAISQWALLDHTRLLNWPKSPHRLGLIACSSDQTPMNSMFSLKFTLFCSAENKFLFENQNRQRNINSTVLLLACKFFRIGCSVLDIWNKVLNTFSLEGCKRLWIYQESYSLLVFPVL